MKKCSMIVLTLVVLLALSGVASAKKPEVHPPGPPDSTGPAEFAAMPNLSFPVVATDIIEFLYQKTAIAAEDGTVSWILTLDEAGNPVPITVTENIQDQYTGAYEGNTSSSETDDFYYAPYIVGEDGCAVDVDGDGKADTEVPILMRDWLPTMAPWYPQPSMTTSDDPNDLWNADVLDYPANSWQADWTVTDAVYDDMVYIEFIDWGNPLENSNPTVGQRYPVEIALYTKLDNPMIAYKTYCLEYPSTRNEVFGISELKAGSFTTEVKMATVLTNDYFVEVWNPDGTRTSTRLDPAIGPSGKMNFASAQGGWIPTMPGVHRIWFHLSDPMISLQGAVINDDEHYIMSSGCMAEELNKNKAEKSAIIGNSTFIDVLVVKPNSNNKKK